MKAARALGISEQRFSGWEPTTFYTYDDAGRLVSSTPEPEWTPLERGWMLALAEYEASHCENCGHDLDEALATEPEDWQVLPPRRCAVCTRVAMDHHARSKEHAERPGGGYLHALRYQVTRRPPRR